MADLFDARRRLLGAAGRYLFDGDRDAPVADGDRDAPPRLTERLLEALRMSRSREKILSNLDEMYREAFERAKVSSDESQMKTLDMAYRREQLYFEILLDVRDALEHR